VDKYTFNNIFTDLIKIDSSKVYEEVNKKERISAIIKAKVNEYNQTNPNNSIDIFVFDDIINLVVRICRTLRMNSKHAILIGLR